MVRSFDLTEPGVLPSTGRDRVERRRQPRRGRAKNELDGWIILDKPVGLTSTQALGAVKRLFSPAKAGHAGTLDPLASGLLPLALGEATKTVPYVVDGAKRYRFTVRWGAATDTDDADGAVTATSDVRPTPEALEGALPAFVGEVAQVPPRYSAVKVAGQRAYDLAREGEQVELAARIVTITRLAVVGTPGRDEATLEADCGKGTYVRAVARDLGLVLGTHAHVTALRRTRVGPFDEADMVTLEALGSRSEDLQSVLDEVLRDPSEALAELPTLLVDRTVAARLRRGQAALLRPGDAPEGTVRATTGRDLIALCHAEAGELRPMRVFRAPRRRLVHGPNRPAAEGGDRAD
ncbi:tRNA pseudouridine(55) synthase TruB [Acuticoccus sp.]|uniref:tRNA pseudouridine(55) synthase TruB n=1 Tax=Acuticoccus sp. TaxID=1904378 RepID=UPI003B518407